MTPRLTLTLTLALLGLLAVVSPMRAEQTDSAMIPVSAVLDEVLVFTVHDPLSFTLVPSPLDARTATEVLAVATNAEGGYTISVSIDQPLTEEGDVSPDIIPSWSGAVDQPLSWPVELIGFGFSRDGGGTYAGFPLNEAVVFTGNQSNGQVLPIDYRVTADSSLDAGSYSATITYTALATF